MKNHTNIIIVSVVSIMLLVFSSGCTDQEDAGQQLTDTSVSVEEARSQAEVKVLESYVLFHSWNTAENRSYPEVLPQTTVFYDSEGEPLYYLFYICEDGENLSALRVSANKLYGRTVIGMGDFGLEYYNESLNTYPGEDVVIAGGFASITPITESGSRYGAMYIDFWENENLYAEDIQNDMKAAGIDISKPISEDDKNVVWKIVADNLEKRGDREEELENKYRVDWVY